MHLLTNWDLGRLQPIHVAGASQSANREHFSIKGAACSPTTHFHQFFLQIYLKWLICLMGQTHKSL